MANNYQRGDLIDLVFQAANGVATELSIKSHNFDLEAMAHDVSGTAHGGRSARIAGKGDFRATVLAAYDLDVPPYLDPPSVRPGVSGVIYLGLSQTHGISIGVIITKLHGESAVDSAVMYSFDVLENVLAGPLIYHNTLGALT